MRELKERTPEFSAAYQLCVARHSRADGVRPTTAPCAQCAAYIVAGVDAAPAQTGEPVEQMNAENIAGMLSTLDFRPAERHPSECLPMARRVIAEVIKRYPLPAPTEEGTPHDWEKVIRDTETYKQRLARDEYIANFGDQAKGIDRVVLPLGDPDAIKRLLRDLVAWGFGMGQAEPESAEALSWHERATVATEKLNAHIAALRAPAPESDLRRLLSEAEQRLNACEMVRDMQAVELDALRRPTPAIEVYCPDCGKPMSQVRKGEAVFLCANLECTPTTPAPVLTETKGAGTWNNWIAPFHRCAYCRESLNWKQSVDVFDRPLISASCICRVFYSAPLSAEKLEDMRAVDAGNKLAADIRAAALRAPAPVPEVREEDVAELANWVGNQVESCEAEIARTDSNKYTPEDEDDAEGVSARLDLPYFRRLAAVLGSIQSRTTGGAE